MCFVNRFIIALALADSMISPIAKYGFTFVRCWLSAGINPLSVTATPALSASIFLPFVFYPLPLSSINRIPLAKKGALSFKGNMNTVSFCFCFRKRVFLTLLYQRCAFFFPRLLNLCLHLP